MRVRRDAHGADADDGFAFRARAGPDAMGKRRAAATRRGPTHYEVLGVPRDATAADLKAAYRRKALETHPDKNVGNPRAEADFLRVQEAKRVLADPRLRKLHDLETEGLDATGTARAESRAES